LANWSKEKMLQQSSVFPNEIFGLFIKQLARCARTDSDENRETAAKALKTFTLVSTTSYHLVLQCGSQYLTIPSIDMTRLPVLRFCTHLTITVQNELECDQGGVLALLTNLKNLNLFDTSLPSFLHNISHLTNLETLFISAMYMPNKTKKKFVLANNAFHSFTTLKLTSLSMQGVFKCEDAALQLRFVSSLTDLTELDLSFGTITNGISYISLLTNMQHLNLSACYMKKSALLYISTFVKLETLRLTILDNIKDEFSFISNLTNIKILDLRECDMEDKDLSYISTLTNIKELHLSYNNITTISFLLKMQKISVLDLNFCNALTEENFILVTALESLNKLYFIGDHQMRTNLQYLSVLSNLKELMISKPEDMKENDFKWIELLGKKILDLGSSKHSIHIKIE
jgi:hypothetical protein